MSDQDQPSNGSTENTEVSPAPPRRRGLIRRLFGGLISLTFLLIIVAIGIAAGGFLKFSFAVQNSTDLGHRHSVDGIIVLTGGAHRLARGVELLQIGVAQQMLLSGVNENTSKESLKARFDDDSHRALFDCCIELGRKAGDTRGNAVEAQDWIARNDMKRVLLVTSAYHMPRALFEFARTVPEDVTILAAPVHVPELPLRSWWKSAEATRVLVREYGKYVLARARENALLGPYVAAYS